jgi:hypothetical protein
LKKKFAGGFECIKALGIIDRIEAFDDSERMDTFDATENIEASPSVFSS